MASDVTLQDVARRAGVSLATASRAFNGSPNRRVREDLRARVLTAAQELGYAPNAHAQAMARGRTNVVGLVVQDIADPYFSTVASAVLRAAEDRGLLVTIAATAHGDHREVEYVETFRRHWTRAVIVVGSRTADRRAADRLAQELVAYESSGGRAVLVGQPLLPVDTIDIENRAGGRALAEALHALGHRRFAVLAGPDQLLTARDRLAGFREGLAVHGCPLRPEHVVHGDFTRDGGYEAMARLLDAGVRVECVFAVNDVMAVGAMAALRDRGLSLPDEVSVAGFDDITTLRDVVPALTTVRVPLTRIGTTALEMALSEDDGSRPRLCRVGGEVVIRASTPPRTPVREGPEDAG